MTASSPSLQVTERDGGTVGDPVRHDDDHRPVHGHLLERRARLDYYIFGGTPPYRIVVNFPNAVTLVNAVVNTNGGCFDAITNGTCFTGLTFAIVDANGRTLLSPPTVNNVEGADGATRAARTAAATAAGQCRRHRLAGGRRELRRRCDLHTHDHRRCAIQRGSVESRRPYSNPNPVPNSPGQLNVSNVPGNAVPTRQRLSPRRSRLATAPCLSSFGA